MQITTHLLSVTGYDNILLIFFSSMSSFCVLCSVTEIQQETCIGTEFSPITTPDAQSRRNAVKIFHRMESLT